MRIALETECIDVFSVVPRTADPQRYSDGIRIVTRLSDKYGYSGVLVYTGHDVYVEPWLAAQEMIRTSADLAPLVAVNPIYMHPFTAARMIASLAYVYGRRVCLNLVTGTALRDLDSLSQLLSHDDRYERLLEYAVLLQRLLAGGNVTYEGKYYQVRNLQLLPRVPAALLPRFFLAGQSDAARRVARDTGATCLHMLPPTLTASGAAGAGVNLGIITREREQEAWAAARARFPENECGQTIHA
jgi:alkanesulfonate monooxygenase